MFWSICSGFEEGSNWAKGTGSPWMLCLQEMSPVWAGGLHPHGSMDGPVQPVPGCRCHVSFPRGYAEPCQGGLCHWAMSWGFWKCISMTPGAEHRDQGLPSAAAPFYLKQRLQLGTPWAGPALNPWCICKASAVQKACKRHNCTSCIKVNFSLAYNHSPSCTINIWGMTLASAAYNGNGTEPWEMIYVDNHALALPWILFSANVLACLLQSQDFFLVTMVCFIHALIS